MTWNKSHNSSKNAKERNNFIQEKISFLLPDSDSINWAIDHKSRPYSLELFLENYAMFHRRLDDICQYSTLASTFIYKKVHYITVTE